MLQNDYLFAKIGVDTAENEPTRDARRETERLTYPRAAQTQFDEPETRVRLRGRGRAAPEKTNAARPLAKIFSKFFAFWTFSIFWRFLDVLWMFFGRIRTSSNVWPYYFLGAYIKSRHHHADHLESKCRSHLSTPTCKT